MYTGKLYRFDEEQFVADVSYRLLSGAPTNFWGELIPAEHGHISDGADYIIELEDSSKIKCNLKKNVNRGTVGVPPRFVYRFVGTARSRVTSAATAAL